MRSAFGPGPGSGTGSGSGSGPGSGPTTALALAVAALVVLAGCSSVSLGGGDRVDDPEEDRLGWEAGYWYDDPVSVTPGDGYNATERAAVVNRTMARVEEIRGLEFNRTVPVEVISRGQYLRNRSGGDPNATHAAWNDQVWEGLFIVPEDASTTSSFNRTLGASVLGYYSPGEESIVLVSDSPTPTIDRGTLAHELVHALQDQHFDLGGNPDTQDTQLAADSVVEGEANAIEARYQNRCDGGWSCIRVPDRGGGGGGGGINRGLLLTILTPYTAGQAFVESVRRDDGWSAVSDLHDAEPDSTEQVIHPGRYPDEDPVNVTVPDRSSAEWRRFDHDPVADVLGEASIYAMFYDNGVVSTDERYSYQSAPSAGWGGDALVPYTRGDASDGDASDGDASDGDAATGDASGDGGGSTGTGGESDAAAETGAYVWKTVWDTRTDARQFADAYRDLLAAHDATSAREGVYVVPESDPYDDAFRVTRNGTTVRIVNAPTVEALDEVHAPGSGPVNGSQTGTGDADSVVGPGFGVASALVALAALLAVAIAVRRRR